MAAIEQEIFNRIQQLNEAQQQRVLDFLKTLQPAPFDFTTWIQQVNDFQAQLKAKQGDNYTVESQALLDEVREGNPHGSHPDY